MPDDNTQDVEQPEGGDELFVEASEVNQNENPWGSDEFFTAQSGDIGPAGPTPETVDNPLDLTEGVEAGDAPAPQDAAATEGDSAEASAGEKEWDSQDLPEHMTAEDAYGMARYMQSQRDKLEQQLKDVQARYEEANATAPLAQYIQEDPQLLSMVSQYLQQGEQGGQPQQAGQAGPQAAQGASPRGAIQRPTKPEKPADFDPYEAVTNPESNSYAFREANEKYLEDLAGYQDQRAQTVEQQLLQQQQAQQAQTVQQQVIQQAMYEHGLNKEEAKQFVEWANSDKSFESLDPWVHAFKAMHAPKEAEPPASTQQAPGAGAAQQARQQKQPLPASVAAQASAKRSSAGQDALLVATGGSDPVWGNP